MNDSLIQGIGIVAGICTSSALIPQVLKIRREKKTDDISVVYLIVLLCGQSLWVLYGALRADIPVVATNSFSVLVSITTIILKFKYRSK